MHGCVCMGVGKRLLFLLSILHTGARDPLSQLVMAFDLIGLITLIIGVLYIVSALVYLAVKRDLPRLTGGHSRGTTM